MPVRPVLTLPPAATFAEAIVGWAALAIDPANGGASRLEIGLHRQTGALQSLESGNAFFGETYALGNDLTIAKIDHHRDLILIDGLRWRNGHENQDRAG